MQESSDLLLRCTPFSPEISRNHLGYLRAAVRVVNNAWTDDARDEAMELLMEKWLKLGCNPPPPQDPMTLDQDPLNGDPSESNVPTCALRIGPQGTSRGVASDIGTPSDASGVHRDDQMTEGDMKEATGAGAIHVDAQQCLTPQPPPPQVP